MSINIGEIIEINSKKYKINKQLGRGGFGVVYKVQSEDGNTYAMKKLYTSDSFDAEMNIQGMEHPNIVKIYSSSKSNGLVLMEYLEGFDLSKKISENYKIKYSEVLKIAIDVASALCELNGKLVHCDIKPENIFITELSAKLVDFGVSKKISNKKSISPKTIAFCAPEQFDEQISNNTDIYSLGISIINALVGDEIFNQKLCGKTEIETVGKRILLPLPGINELVPGLVPKSFDGIIRKCTKK